MNYAYTCATHGTFEVPVAADRCLCPDCAEPSRRVWAVAIHRAGARPTERYWDPQVGAVVGSQREFNDLLKAGIERQERELNMEVKLTGVDVRDTEGLAELHGHSVEERQAEKENTQRVLHDEKVKANKEQKAKVLTS